MNKETINNADVVHAEPPYQGKIHKYDSLSAKAFYRISKKTDGDWLIPRQAVCLILGVSEWSFHHNIQKRGDLPLKQKFGHRDYYSMSDILQYATKLDKEKALKN